MAKILAALLVCYLLSSVSEGKPVPPRQSFAKTPASNKNLPSQQEEQPTPTLDDCSQFCSQSYPQHTYPVPSHHKACVTGCHSARVDALIAWPFSSFDDRCTSACSEAYPSGSELQYACSTGCNATTIDSLFPDRGVIYSEISMNDNSSSVSSDSVPLEQFANLVNSIFNGFFDGFSFGPDVEKLTEHASQMSQLLQPAKSSVITYIFDDGEAVEMREYSFQGDVVIENLDDIVKVDPIADSQSSDSQKASDSNDVSGSLDSVYVYYSPNSRERCKWFVWRIVASRVLLGLAIVFIGLAAIMCGLGMLRSNSNRNVKERKMPTVVQSHTPNTVKVPLDGSSKFRPDHSHLMLPVHVKVGGDKMVEGVITVM